MSYLLKITCLEEQQETGNDACDGKDQTAARDGDTDAEER
jgi:hypothetical protein